ncbi:MAG: TonB-dependent receptor plug domain-containing protein [Sedimentisphaerales bacterium]|nr:TonB-dependent receptor plug domain-containing protein [Sedimentisphaerales bacterium]
MTMRTMNNRKRLIRFQGLLLAVLFINSWTIAEINAEVDPSRTEPTDQAETAEESPTMPSKAVFEENPEMMLFMNVPEIISTSLTKTTNRLTPSTVTVITQDDIRASGARSLVELLDICVPNFQTTLHHVQPRNMGLRGLLSDRDDKYLLLVNGRVMNERTHFGVLMERDLPMLNDIHHIDVVRGPGSAMYGPGALAMVINIITDTAETFQGNQVDLRLGAIDEFYAWEFKHGKKFDDGGGLFLYGGLTKPVGADSDDAPMIYGSDGHEHDAILYPASFRDRLKYKLHAQYTKENFNLWARYTSGGETHEADPEFRRFMIMIPDSGSGYQQATVYVSNKHELNSELSIQYAFSYDMLASALTMFSPQGQGYREDEYYGKLLAIWNPHPDHSFAVGGEWSHEEFGLRCPGWPHQPPTYPDSMALTPLPRWNTDTRSVLTEWQWNVNEQWTSFFGGRIDWHTFTQPMYSPRFTLVHTPNDKDTLKFMWSQAARTNLATEMKINYDTTGDNTETERLRAYELRYEHQFDPYFLMSGSAYYHDHNITGFDIFRFAPLLLGNTRTVGAELEAAYQTEKTKLAVSHGWTKLINMRLAEGNISTVLTAEPYGYGNDLAAWNNHVTKITARHQLTNQFDLDGSLRIYWGLPGGEDMAQYYNQAYWVTYNPGNSRPFDPSFFFNLGATWHPVENLDLRLGLYNVLGWFDHRLNKHNYTMANAVGDYRSPAPAVVVSGSYRF